MAAPPLVSTLRKDSIGQRRQVLFALVAIHVGRAHQHCAKQPRECPQLLAERWNRIGPVGYVATADRLEIFCFAACELANHLSRRPDGEGILLIVAKV
ncbi:MAG: hypothetical protein WBM74_07875, partial [Polyangiales bacterium]